MIAWLLAAILISWAAVWVLFRPRRVPTCAFRTDPPDRGPPSTTEPLSSPICRFLQASCCSVAVSGDDVRVLRSPSEFFSELTGRIDRAKHDILISALYIGDGPLSKRFVEALETKVRDRMLRPEDGPLAITILLDHNRMHHAKNLVTLQSLMELAENISSASNMNLLDTAASLVSVRLFLYDTPSSLSRWLAPFGRAKEIIGVQHTKLFLFDGSDALLTGANLSDDYFTNRMDRYLVVSDSPALVFWCRELALTLCRLSHQVVCQAALKRATPLADRRNSPGKSRLHRKSCLVIMGATADGLDPAVDCGRYKQLAEKLLVPFASPDFFESYVSPTEGKTFANLDRRPSARVADTLIFPTLQLARANIFHDSSVVEGMLARLGSNHRVAVTSPYLNMYHGFVEQIIATPASYDFITASAQANGWKGQRGFAGYIPLYYTQLERAFYFLMEHYKCLHRVRVFEFGEAGKTYHAKGLWIADATKGDARPFVTAVGSTNYGSRSVLKDVEAEMFLVSANSGLRDRIACELRALLGSSTEAQRVQFLGDRPGRFQPVVSLIAQLGQDFL
jgi:CDP-diacylglycerol--glycerol-3-phosphate 3-phosphatidyltransferase